MKGYKTYTGIAILALPVLARVFFGIELPEAEAQLIVEQFSALIGSLLAVYGRMDAKK